MELDALIKNESIRLAVGCCSPAAGDVRNDCGIRSLRYEVIIHVVHGKILGVIISNCWVDVSKVLLNLHIQRRSRCV